MVSYQEQTSLLSLLPVLPAFSLEPPEHFAPRGLAFGFAQVGPTANHSEDPKPFNNSCHQRSLQRFPLRGAWRPYGRWGDPASMATDERRRRMKTDHILGILEVKAS